jgi:hypothetical protein
MRSSLPPKVANWLLERFDVDEALIGDLAEEYGRDHSRAWFWRQTVVAVIKKGAVDVRSHKLLAVRAVVIGWMVASLVGWTTKQFVIPLLQGSWSWRSEVWLDAQLGFPIIPLPFLMTTAIGAVVTGWVVARSHRPQAMSMLLIYMASLLLFQVGGFVNSFERGLRSFGGVYGLAFNSVFPFIVVPACLMLGGLLGAQRDRHRGTRNLSASA